MKRFLMLAAVLAMTAGVADAAGSTCKDPVSHQYIKCPTASAPAASGMSSVKPAAGACAKPPHCTVGKLCGCTCIKATDHCNLRFR